MTQEKAILLYLEAGNSITPLDALIKFGSLRLAARIYDLRANGYDIKVRKKKVGDCIVAEYYM